jgi:UDP-N-acetylmuramoyl-tripeptide--D-alanyl-D-alanine ligase
VPLEPAAACLAQVEPVRGRMWPVILPNGCTVLRDDRNSTLPELEAWLDTLRVARAGRRIAVQGCNVLDAETTSRHTARYIGTRAAESADLCVFLGPLAKLSAKAAVGAGTPAGSAFAFEDLREAASFLRSELRGGDLVLLHGYMGHHIERLILAQQGSIRCWLERCHKEMLCERCPELGFVSIEQAPQQSSRIESSSVRASS